MSGRRHGLLPIGGSGARERADWVSGWAVLDQSAVAVAGPASGEETVVTMVEELASVQAAVVAAVGRYLEQTAGVEMEPSTRGALLLRLLRSAGYVIVPAGVPTAAPIRVEGWVQLEPRDLVILNGIAEGMTNAALGRELFIAENTVKGLTKRLFRRLGARDRSHAVRRGYELGLLRVGS